MWENRSVSALRRGSADRMETGPASPQLGIVLPQRRFWHLLEKPAPALAPSRLAMIGRYILQPEVMAILADGEPGAGNEIQLTDGMAKLIGRQPFHAWSVTGDRYDCGDKTGLIQANIALALERPDIGPAIRRFITAMIQKGVVHI